MHHIPLKGGGKMPALGFGTWMLSGESCVRAVAGALEIGYRHIDTAQIYQNEVEVGRALAQSAIPREELFITTKLWTDSFKERDVAPALQASLDRLQLDYIDLYLMHWPNPNVMLAETLGMLEFLMKNNRTRAIGVSNFPVRLMRQAVHLSKAPIACNQVEYHVLLSQRAVLNYARSNDIAVTAYCPLARGRLVSHPVLQRIGRKHDKTAAQVALRWLIAQDGVAAIPKTASTAGARENFDIFDFILDESDKQELAELSGNERQIDPAFAPEWDED